VYDSVLSEYGVLGFEYGNSIYDPRFLTLWEAQFGDFANGAQIIIDQFIASAETKWQQMSGLVMLLPHGYEGQGPEHSSARLERFLQLCAHNNIQVMNLTTPAQIFHALRRQVRRPFRKPLVIMSPKVLLRHPKAISRLDDLAKGMFQEVIDDPSAQPTKVEQVILCSGKLYYELLEEQSKQSHPEKFAIIRVEQLYPFPSKKLAKLLSRYKGANSFVWAQEEPKNMGAYSYMLMNFDLVKWRLASLKAYAAPAAGSHTRDRRRHADAIRMVFDKNLFR
jgi:2-oxoglutarate dehydrogenase E1 component